MKIALISCSKSKATFSCEAKDMYTGDVFKKSYRYAIDCLNVDKVYILSAKYGLLNAHETIQPYDLTLKDFSPERKKEWANDVFCTMQTKFDLPNCHFYILAGKDYYQDICEYLYPNCELPIPPEHRKQGKRNQFLTNELKKHHESRTQPTSLIHGKLLHDFFNKLQEYTYRDINNLPFLNGIYVIFEKGELYGTLKRIVRVGTHKQQNNLKSRLRAHFISKNKDGSIFRKNIGKALLYKRNDSYLDTWTLNTSKKENRIRMDIQKQRSVELKVSEYMQNNMTFSIIEIYDANKRLRIEKGLIASLAHDNNFTQSTTWLGAHSPEHKIKNSHMWLKQGLQDKCLTDDELNYILSSTPPAPKPVHSLPKNTLRNSNFQAKITTSSIKAHIVEKIEKAKQTGQHEITIISGNIHKELLLKNKMPMVCRAMYSIQEFRSKVLHTTKSQQSSTIKIKFFF